MELAWQQQQIAVGKKQPKKIDMLKAQHRDTLMPGDMMKSSTGTKTMMACPK